MGMKQQGDKVARCAFPKDKPLLLYSKIDRAGCTVACEHTADRLSDGIGVQTVTR